jgi:hypothetical protein
VFVACAAAAAAACLLPVVINWRAVESTLGVFGKLFKKDK